MPVSSAANNEGRLRTAEFGRTEIRYRRNLAVGTGIGEGLR